MTMKVVLALCHITALVAARGRTKFTMPEYEFIDQNQHPYDSIVDEDIWEFNVVTQMGVLNMTTEMYTERVLPHKKGDKPWFFCILTSGVNQQFWYSSYLMKSLYFLQRDFPEKATYAFVDASEEFIRETFDYEKIPNCIYLVDGKPFYANWDVLGINTMQEFMVRHEELSNEAIDYLMPVPSAISIYPHYWLKGLGVYLNYIEKWTMQNGKKSWRELTGDTQLKYYPHAVLDKLAILCFVPNHKKAALNFVAVVILPLIAALTVLAYLGCFCCCCRCCCKKVAIAEETELLDKEAEETKKTQ